MTDEPLKTLTTGGQRLVAAALQNQVRYNHPALGVHHWLLALLERHAAMAVDLCSQIDAEALKASLSQQLQAGESGAPLPLELVISRSLQGARQRGKDQPAERDLARVILSAAGYPVVTAGGIADPDHSGPGLTNLCSLQASRRPTPMLDQYGRDLTQAARQGKLPAVTQRDEEIQLILEILCRRTKRNPALVGPAGVGKTAIVEGLAQRIVAGQAPAALHDLHLIALQPGTLTAGARHYGDLEERMQKIIAEASQEGITLFIDEMHSLMGAGGIPGTTDLAGLLKPSLARGELACIAATTDDEYRRFIEADAALERRFQPIRIQELSPEQTFQVLRVVRDELQSRALRSQQQAALRQAQGTAPGDAEAELAEAPLRQAQGTASGSAAAVAGIADPATAIAVDDETLRWMIHFAQEHLRNRYFPDKAIDLLEQSYAYALAHDQSTLSLSDVQAVARRMVGMPAALDERLARLQEQLQRQGLLPEAELTRLVNILQVTLRGLDLRTHRPNAVILLNQDRQERSETLAAAIAGALYGAVERVISIDFSPMQHPADINLLIGAPPGYVGYSENLPLHALAQTPWCVLRFLHLDACHPSIRQFVASGLSEGRITDGRGRPIYFNDTVILITTSCDLRPQRSIGFPGAVGMQPASPDLAPGEGHSWVVRDEELREALRQQLGSQLVDQVDVLLHGETSPGKGSGALDESWGSSALLEGLSKRFLNEGLRLTWDESLVQWLDQQQTNRLSRREMERWINETLGAAVVPYLKYQNLKQPLSLLVSMENEHLVMHLM